VEYTTCQLSVIIGARCLAHMHCK